MANANETQAKTRVLINDEKSILAFEEHFFI